MIKKGVKPIIIGNGKVHQNELEEENKEEEELLKKIDDKKRELEEVENLIVQKKNELDEIAEKISFELEEADLNVQKIIKDAEDKAEYEYKVSQNRGYQDGYQEGIEQGKEEIIEKAKNIFMRAQSIIEEAVEIKLKSIEENEKELIVLAIEIAKKIIRQEVLVNPEIVRNNLYEAVKKVPVSRKLKIILNWEDLEYVKNIKDTIISEMHGVDKVEIVEDKNMEKGGCVLETSMGTIDASINAQLEKIYDIFMEINSENRKCNEEGCEIEERYEN